MANGTFKLKIVHLEGIRDVSKWSPKLRAPYERIMGAEEFARYWTDSVDSLHAIGQTNDGDICSGALSQIRCPTLIVHGGRDPIVSDATAALMRRHIAGAEYYEIAAGRHDFHLRFADEFNRAIAKFLIGRTDRVDE